jgi:hypothetical protein
MRYSLAFAIIALVAITPVRADTSAYMAQQLARYQKYAGAPVEDFPIIDLWQWQVVGKEKIVVWPTINTAYLITVDKPCPRLEWTRGLSITQNMSMHVTRRFDSVNFEHQRCRIAEIRPIDYKALRADEKAAKAGK